MVIKTPDPPLGKFIDDEADFLGIVFRIFGKLKDFIFEKAVFFRGRSLDNDVDHIFVFFRNEPLDKVQCLFIQNGKALQEPDGVSDALHDRENPVFVSADGADGAIEQIIMLKPVSSSHFSPSYADYSF